MSFTKKADDMLDEIFASKTTKDFSTTTLLKLLERAKKKGDRRYEIDRITLELIKRGAIIIETSNG